MRYLLFYLLLTTPTFAIYNLTAIDITPSPEGTQFCFQIDTNAEEMYLALTEDYENFLFLNDELTATLWQPPTEPPLFLKKDTRFKPSCFGPFPNESLQNIKLFAGVGNSFSDVIEKQQYTQIFAGFPTLEKQEKLWTIMVYLVGSSLERITNKVTKGQGSQDLLEMLAGTSAVSSESVHVIVTTGGSSRTGWKTVKRLLIHQGQQYVLEDLGAQNMAEPQTLSDFVAWATTQFPAQHNALILWNHGGGTQGFGQDTSLTGGDKMMNLQELQQAYQTIRQQQGKPLDIIVYDACLMASIEVAEITATATDTMAASAELEPGHGLDYTHLISQVENLLPENGIEFGQIVKSGYLQHTKDKGTFNTAQITYSLFDLTQLPPFREAFKQFAVEFRKVLEDKAYLNYQRLSEGIIQATGYPFIETGRFSTLRSSLDQHHIRLDLYDTLQRIGPKFPDFKAQAEASLAQLDQLIVDYETNDNVSTISSHAGRLSIDIAVNYDEDSQLYNTAPHIALLPEAYQLVNEGLIFYDQRRRTDGLKPDSKKVCMRGTTCAEAQWLELRGDDVLGVEAYFGQQTDTGMIAYLLDKIFYQRQTLEEDKHIGVDGHKACRYQLCTGESQCTNITVVEQGQQLVTELLLNDTPTMLSFCQETTDTWLVCSVVSQIAGVWGRRETTVYPEDILKPIVVHIGEDIVQKQSETVTVTDPKQVLLKRQCDTAIGAVTAVFYGANGQRQFQPLCNKGDCICEENSEDEGCQEMGFKAGVRILY